jgi:hypothetical protein
MSINRNAPCPCGSEKKYKHCCGATGAPPPPVVDAEGVAVPRAWKLPALLFAIAIGVGVGVGILRDAIQDGLAVSLALLVLVLGYLVIRAPPSSTGRGGGANINFGMNKPKRRAGAPNRSTRRRD